MKPVTVLMPSLGKQGNTTAESLAAHAPFPFHLTTTDMYGWSASINYLKETWHEPGRDLLIIDDDVTVLPGTFNGLLEHWDEADVFGFKLLFPDGSVQHDGGLVSPIGATAHLLSDSETPGWVAYVTASLCYIKEEAINDIFPLPVWPGIQWEDVALCLNAWRSGHRVAYVPSEAIHAETATKIHEAGFAEKFNYNALAFRQAYQQQCARMSLMFGIKRKVRFDQPIPSL